jgi:hypothetical protein
MTTLPDTRADVRKARPISDAERDRAIAIHMDLMTDAEYRYDRIPDWLWADLWRQAHERAAKEFEEKKQ